MINRPIISFFFLCQSCFFQAQNTVESGFWSVGLIQEFHKFNQFSCARVQFEKNKNSFAINLGFSPQKATQHIFGSTTSVDYARLWKFHRVSFGPACVFSIDTYVFGTRFSYLHSSVGYRFVIGKKWQFFQEGSVGPTMESFTYQNQLNKHFTWNCHFKFGVQYALR